MAKRKRKEKKSIAERALHKLRHNGPSVAVRYIVNQMVAKRNPNLIFEGIPEYVIEKARAEAVKRIREITRKKMQEKKFWREQERERKEKKENHHREVLKGYLKAENKIRYCAGLPVEDRAVLSGVTDKEFWRKVIEFRKNCVTAKKATEILGCSYYQLDKWDKQGLVPHVYTRVIYIDQAGKFVETRFWNVDELKSINVEELRNRRKEKQP